MYLCILPVPTSIRKLHPFSGVIQKVFTKIRHWTERVKDSHYLRKRKKTGVTEYFYFPNFYFYSRDKKTPCVTVNFFSYKIRIKRKLIFTLNPKLCFEYFLNNSSIAIKLKNNNSKRYEDLMPYICLRYSVRISELTNYLHSISICSWIFQKNILKQKLLETITTTILNNFK